MIKSIFKQLIGGVYHLYTQKEDAELLENCAN